jgi:hypothetical protein
MRPLLSVLLFFTGPLALPVRGAAGGPVYNGTVVANGQPVEEAQVWLRYSRPGDATRDALIGTRTDAQGRFSLAVPAKGDAQVSGVIARVADGRIGWFSLPRDDPADKGGLHIDLYAVADAKGRLSGPAGRPISQARIRVQAVSIGQRKGIDRPRQLSIPDDLAALFEATTKADGTFVLPGIPVGANVSVSVSAPGHGDPYLSWNQGQPGDFRLEPAGRVRVRFIGADDPRQLAGASLELITRVAADARVGKPFAGGRKVVKAKGEATLDIENVFPGRGEFRFWKAPEVQYLPKQLPKFAVKAGTQTEVTIALEAAAHVRGRVIDQKSKAGIAGVAVYLVSQSKDTKRQVTNVVKTGADGWFTAYVRPEMIDLQLLTVPAGYVTPTRELVKPAEVAAGATHTFPDIALEPAVPVNGVVVDKAGKPVSGVQVRTTEVPFARRRPLVTDSMGRFELRSLGAGDVIALRVRSDRAVTDGGVLVDPAAQKGPVRLVLSEKAACRVTGRVTDNLGKAVAGASVRVHWYYRGVGRRAAYGSSTLLEVVRTDAEGRFRSGVLWPGDDYRVDVTAEGHGKAESIQVKGKAGQVHDLGVVTLTRTGGQVQGVVADTAGQPLAGVTVFNQGDAPEPLSTTSDAAGRFHLSGLYDGPFFVFARKEGYRFSMARAGAEDAEVRITLRKTTEEPPAFDSPARSPGHVAAEQKLLLHLLDKTLALSEAATGGYRRSVFECLAGTDPGRAQKWLDDARASGHVGPKDLPRYVRALRVVQAERVAGADAEEAITLLADLDNDAAFTALVRLAERFRTTDPARALRFAEEAVVRARALELPNRAWSLAHAGNLVARLGQQGAGTKLLDEAAALADKLGTEGRQMLGRAEVARFLAPYDLPRARALLRTENDPRQYNHWLSRIAVALARTDSQAALALVGELKEDRSTVREVTRLQIARQVAGRDPAEAARLAEAIPDVRYRAEALVYVAAASAARDRKLAWSLIDKALAIYLDQADAFRSWSNYGGRSTFAAWTAGQAQALGYPDMASVVAQVLACRPTGQEAHSPAHALEIQVRMAKVLALVDPAVARQMVDRVHPQQALLGTGYSGFERKDWLLARCLANPARGPALVDETMAHLDRKDNMAFYHSGLMQLAQVLTEPPERRVRVVMGLNSGLVVPDED